MTEDVLSPEMEALQKIKDTLTEMKNEIGHMNAKIIQNAKNAKTISANMAQLQHKIELKACGKLEQQSM